jgi:hypothetical protein
MGKQITLLDGPECHICQQPLQLDGNVYQGFKDGDTGEFVHHGSCKNKHYELKFKTLPPTYTEVPVTPTTYFK